MAESGAEYVAANPHRGANSVSASNDDPTQLGQFLERLEVVQPAQLDAFLMQQGSHLQQDDWSELFYAIEELAEKGQSERALELLQGCLRFADRGSDEWAKSSVRYFLGNVYLSRGEIDEAVRAYQWAATHQRDLQAAALAYSAISGARMGQGRLPEAIAAAKEALALDQQRQCINSQIEDLLSLANLYLTQEDFAEAEATVAEATRLAETVPDPLRFALAWSIRGDIQTETFDYPAALDSYDLALDTLDGIDEPDDLEFWFKVYATKLGSKAMLLEEMGRCEEAAAAYSSAARMSHAIDDTRDQVQYLTWMGTCQRAAGRGDLAFRSFAAARRLCESVGFVSWIVTIGLHEANALREAGRVAEAEVAVEHAMQSLGEIAGDKDVDEGLCLMHLGDIKMDQRLFSDAVIHYSRAAELFSRGAVGAMHRRIVGKLGAAYRRLGDLQSAYETLKQALSVYEDKRKTLRQDAARIDFGSSRDEIYNDLVRTCFDLGNRGEAFFVAEESKGRVLREQLAHGLLGVSTDRPIHWTEVTKCLHNE